MTKQEIKEQMIKYGFHAPDMTVTEFVEDIITNKPQKTGRWLKVDDDEPIAYDCSECGAMVHLRYRFCPECGAKMQEDPV